MELRQAVQQAQKASASMSIHGLHSLANADLRFFTFVFRAVVSILSLTTIPAICTLLPTGIVDWPAREVNLLTVEIEADIFPVNLNLYRLIATGMVARYSELQMKHPPTPRPPRPENPGRSCESPP